MTMHQFQHRIATTLKRNMEMRHERTAFCTESDQFIRQQVGFQRTDPITTDALYSIKSLHQVEELLSRRLTKVADVHTRQHNLPASLPGRFLCLGHQRGDRRIP